MKSEFRNKMYNMELPPPAEAWTYIQNELDQAASDGTIAQRMYDSVIPPPQQAWQNISTALNEGAEKSRSRIIPIIRYAAVAAVFTGIVISLWFLRKPSGPEEQVVINPAIDNPVQQNTDNITNQSGSTDEDIPESNNLPKPLNQQGNSSKSFAANTSQSLPSRTIAGISPISQSVHPSMAIRQAKADDLPLKPQIDDLSLVATDNQYLTMVNANGRLVKIPIEFAHLAPRFQNKPVEEDFYELIFGQGNFWKETVDDWRQRLATNPSMNGDIFSSVLAVLKSLEN